MGIQFTLSGSAGLETIKSSIGLNIKPKIFWSYSKDLGLTNNIEIISQYVKLERIISHIGRRFWKGFLDELIALLNAIVHFMQLSVLLNPWLSAMLSDFSDFLARNNVLLSESECLLGRTNLA